MTHSPAARVRVGIHPSLDHSLQEIQYVFRTLLRIAGYPWEFTWADGGEVDIYYGPDADSATAAVLRIESCGARFLEAGQAADGRIAGDWNGLANGAGSGDPVFAAYWLLTGAAESRYRRDRWDNLYLDGTVFLQRGLLSRPLVSLYASALRDRLARQGRAPRRFPWECGGRSWAFAFSHDVDYPEIIRPIECLRLLRERGRKAWPSVAGVLRGDNHFWKFNEWVDFERELNARPAFYFMARQGSLVQYAAGTPDAFYDIQSPRFRKLFRYLADEGCEIGLHASYHAFRDVRRFRDEKRLLEEQAETVVSGNRHHYWHLDPEAPNDTLALHEQAGLEYDSSLGFEFYPGFRRGACHPFRPYHPGRRRELDLVEVPPAWMDDHFHRRLRQNGVASPEDQALRLLKAARATHGVIVVDYHARGMNGDFYPQYGPWLMSFLRKHIDGEAWFATPGEIAEAVRKHDAVLEAASRDLTHA